MQNTLRALTLALPFSAIAFYALIVGSQLQRIDPHLVYVGPHDLVDSGVGWFSIFWIVGVIPFTLFCLVSWQFGKPTSRYWMILWGSFLLLSASGFFLDHIAFYQICPSCN